MLFIDHFPQKSLTTATSGAYMAYGKDNGLVLSMAWPPKNFECYSSIHAWKVTYLYLCKFLAFQVVRGVKSTYGFDRCLRPSPVDKHRRLPSTSHVRSIPGPNSLWIGRHTPDLSSLRRSGTGPHHKPRGRCIAWGKHLELKIKMYFSERY